MVILSSFGIVPSVILSFERTIPLQ